MDDFRARMAGEKILGEQTDDVIPLDEAPLFIEEEAAVEIAVPGDPQVGAVFEDGIAGGSAVFRQQGIGDAVGKGPFGLVMNLDELEGQMRLQRIDDRSGAAVAGIDHHPQRLLRLSVPDSRGDGGYIFPARRGGKRPPCRPAAGQFSAAARSRIASRPLSPLIGCDPARTSFMPL